MIGMALGLGMKLFSGLSSKEQTGVGIAAILVPVAMLIGGYFYGNAKYNEGFASRDDEVEQLISERDDKIKKLSQTQTSLNTCTTGKAVLESENRELRSYQEAQQKAHIDALEAQKETTKAAQENTENAVRALAQAKTDNNSAFEGIRSTLEGLKDAQNDGGSNCVVLGGKRVLQHARSGKVQE